MRCLSSVHIEPIWVVDPTGRSLEDVYLSDFAKLIENTGSQLLGHANALFRLNDRFLSVREFRARA